MDIKLAKLSGHDKSAKVGKILVEENQEINVNDTLIDAEWRKGSFKVKSEYKGKITKILIKK